MENNINIPNDFLPLPEGGPWSADMREAYKILRDMHRHSSEVLRREDNEPVHLNILWNTIYEKAVPLLEALLDCGFSEPWVISTTYLFAKLALDLKTAESASEGV